MADDPTPAPLDLLLVTSSGGVLLDLLALEPWWSRHRTRWVAVEAEDTMAALDGQKVDWIGRPSSRLAGGVAGAWAALRMLTARRRPDVIVSAGSGVAIGFFVLARLLGVPAFWVETLNMVGSRGLASRVCSRLASEVLVQRAALLEVHPGGVLIGELY